MKRVLAVCAALALSACASPSSQHGGDSSGRAKATYQTKPRYPRPLQEAGMQGCVVASFVIGPDGRAQQYAILDSVPKGMFDHAAIATLGEWRFAQPERPGRYAQELTYRVDAPYAIRPQRECQPVPSFEALNAGAGKP